MTTEQVQTKFNQGKTSFRQGKTIPLDWRMAQLAALEQMLVDHEDTFCDALYQDLRKPPAEAWLTEVSFVLGASRHARKNLRRWSRDRRVPTPVFAMPGRSWVHPEPLGNVLIIAPWNYPLQLCLAPLVTTIAAGNCTVIKPSELAPATSAALARLLPDYLDPDCVGVIEGGVETSSALLDLDWDHIIFTGGERVAKIVMAAAARHLTPVTLELGGKSPCIVLPDADLQVAARRITWGRFTNAGQTCIAPDHVLTDAATRERLIPLLEKEINGMFGDDPSASADYGRIVNTAHFDRVSSLIVDSETVIGGRCVRDDLYIAPTVLSGVTKSSPSMCSEIFGPVLPIMEIDSLESAIRFVKDGAKPLAAYLFSNSSESCDLMVSEISAGSVCLNDVMVFMAVDELPFGGVGISGTGTYKGEAGFRQLSHNKAVLKRSYKPDWRMRYAPMSKNKMKWLRKFR